MPLAADRMPTPLHRGPSVDCRQQARRASHSPVVRALLDAADGVLLVLNEQLEILAANRELLGDRSLACVIGLRPGEAISCISAAGGRRCGESEVCGQCGARRTVLRCLREDRVVEGECILSIVGEQGVEPREYSVRVAPVVVDGERMLVVAMRDVSDAKRRQVLEQLFFHDVLNTLGGLLGWSRLLATAEGQRREEITERIRALALRLEREVVDQRTLLAAERGELRVHPSALEAGELLEELRLLFLHHRAARERVLALCPPAQPVALRSDPAILLRVLVNMVTNALESSGAGGRVTVTCRPGTREGRATVVFEVHNETAIPAEVRLRIFQRSFSTKAGKGRGLGTYSMRLLGERHLGGRVSFESSDEEGTTFYFELPADAESGVSAAP